MERLNEESALADIGLVNVKVREIPIKSEGNELLSIEELQAQAEVARDALVPVDYENTRGTCLDEREREGLVNGQPSEVRPSAPGGPDIYALSIGELTGMFGENSTLEDDLVEAHDLIEGGGLLGGCHVGCAASQISPWMTLIGRG